MVGILRKKNRKLNINYVQLPVFLAAPDSSLPLSQCPHDRYSFYYHAFVACSVYAFGQAAVRVYDVYCNCCVSVSEHTLTTKCR
jgi:hypothetical protein